jgi:hypothetical protein
LGYKQSANVGVRVKLSGIISIHLTLGDSRARQRSRVDRPVESKQRSLLPPDASRSSERTHELLKSQTPSRVVRQLQDMYPARLCVLDCWALRRSPPSRTNPGPTRGHELVDRLFPRADNLPSSESTLARCPYRLWRQVDDLSKLNVDQVFCVNSEADSKRAHQISE